MVVVRAVMITLVTFTQLYKREQINKPKSLEILSKLTRNVFNCKSLKAQFLPLFWGQGRGSSPRLGLGKIEARAVGRLKPSPRLGLGSAFQGRLGPA